jgi:WD40 repeat protein
MSSVTHTSARPTVFWEVDLDSHIAGVGFTGDRAFLVAGTVDGEMAIVDVGRGAVRSRWQAHQFGLSSFAVSPDGERIATCGHDGRLGIWNAHDGSPVASLELRDNWGTAVAYSPSGKCIAAAAGKHLVIVSPDGDLVRSFDPAKSTISDLGWSPIVDKRGNETLATVGYMGVTLWDVGTAAPRRFEWKGSSLVLAWSPDARYIATGDQDSTVHFWIVKKAEDLQMSGYPLKVKELSWSSDSRYLATGGGDVVTVWDCSGRGPAGTQPISLEGHEDKITTIAFRHRGDVLASGDSSGRVIFWSISQDASRDSLEFASGISAIAWSDDDELLAIGTSRGVLHCASR